VWAVSKKRGTFLSVLKKKGKKGRGIKGLGFGGGDRAEVIAATKEKSAGRLCWGEGGDSSSAQGLRRGASVAGGRGSALVFPEEKGGKPVSDTPAKKSAAT